MRLWMSKKAGGMLAYYGLEEWWQTTFTDGEQRYIDDRFQPMGSGSHSLTQGNLVSSSMTVTQFLSSLSTWFDSHEDQSIVERILNKMDELARAHPISKPGYYNGRHFTTYVSDVRKLLKDARLEDAESLLIKLVEATEAESNTEGLGVAPWYYERLAIIYRRRREAQKEVTILERFLEQKFAPGAKRSKLMERLNKARQLLTKSTREQE
jgi:hypothetical protein